MSTWLCGPWGRTAAAARPCASHRRSSSSSATWRPPAGADIRLDSHVYPGYAVPSFYDSLLGKLIVRGDDRADAYRMTPLKPSHSEACVVCFHHHHWGKPAFQLSTGIRICARC